MKLAKYRLKQYMKSATIWFNTIGLAILTAALAEPLLVSYLNDNGFMYLIIIGNIVLRFKTTEALHAKSVD